MRARGHSDSPGAASAPFVSIPDRIDPGRARPASLRKARIFASFHGMSALNFRFLPLAFGLACAWPALAAYSPLPIPAFVQRAGFDAAAVPPAHQGADDDYWLLLDEQYDLAAHSRYTHAVRKALTGAGVSEISRLSIGFDPGYEKVRFHRLAVWRGGAMRGLLPGLQPTSLRREAEWEDGMLDGRRTLIFKLEDIRPGDILEYEYTIDGDNPIFAGRASGSADLGYIIPVERRRLRLTSPSDRTVFVKSLNGAPEAGSERRGKDLTRIWDLRRSAPILVDRDAPSWFEAYPRVQWSEYRDWSGVAAWARAMYDFNAPLSPALERWLQRHRGLDAKARLRAAVKFAQDSVRYLGLEIGVSSHKPAPPGTVFARRYGDCKDKAFLLCALLRRMGFEAHPALVNTVFRKSLESFQPSPLAFNHVIARVVADRRVYWIDATRQGLKGDPLSGQDLTYGKALTLAPGSAGLEDIRVEPDAGGEARLTLTFKIARWDTTAVLELLSEYDGSEAEYFRAQMASANREETAKRYLDYYSTLYSTIRTAAPFEVEDDTVRNRLVLREHYLVDDVCERAKETGRLECSFYPKEIAASVEKPDRKRRNSPYPLAFPKQIDETIVIEAPGEFDFQPDRGKAGTDAYEFSWDESGHGRVVTLAYHYSAKSDHVPADSFPEYLSSLEKIHDNLGMTIYPESLSDNPNYMYILFLAGAALASGWGARRILRIPARRDPDLYQEPWPLGGALWLIGFGVLLRPLVGLYEAWQFRSFLNQTVWNSLTVRGGGAYHPWFEPVLLAESALLMGSIFVGFALWPLLWRRRASFPHAYAIATGLNLVNGAIDFAAQRGIPSLADEADSPGSLIGGGFWLLFWTLYLFRSERARNTFVHPRTAPQAIPPRPAWGSGAAAAAPGEDQESPRETDTLP
jgi:hypothetical protein